MKIYPLYEGSYSIDKNHVFKSFDPIVDLKADRKGATFLDINPFLLVTSTDVILLDTGLGQRNEAGELKIFDNIRKVGYQPEDITIVLFSHLHKDHVGGLATTVGDHFEMNFPNACHYISKKEWELVNSLQKYTYRFKGFEMLENSEHIEFLTESMGMINDQITYETTGGHTDFHLVFHIKEGGEHVFFGGDILTMPEQVGSRLMSKNDKDPKKALEVRNVLVARAAAEKWLCVFYHGTHIKTGRIIENNGNFEVVEV
ncbi:MAG: MBL fold metallo-hydrolase [Flavobacterium sp.]|nr:MBL fold metallo-hydrolase [Candidatus Neoflavobacterium equi]